MQIENAVMAFAGLMIMVSVALAWAVSPWFLLLTAFVGANLFQTAFTGFCPAAIILKKLGLKAGSVFR
ncbi:MAG: DUF2892 domain-containing protein [Beijerinckiaceae bacterium]|nr:DUF2892 domain-containing protein [Beijerinckiaceae bacterium]MCZ8300287.1 DUF2892 domain-containing protein [Beijerinckiaceae bacterium]